MHTLRVDVTLAFLDKVSPRVSKLTAALVLAPEVDSVVRLVVLVVPATDK